MDLEPAMDNGRLIYWKVLRPSARIRALSCILTRKPFFYLQDNYLIKHPQKTYLVFILLETFVEQKSY